MKRVDRRTVLILIVAATSILAGGFLTNNGENTNAVQNEEQAVLEVEFLPDRHTIPQNESVSLAVQIHNKVNKDTFALVRVYEPSGRVANFRVAGETPNIRHNNSRMWQSSNTLGPRQRLVIPITMEPGSQPGQYTVYAQVKYFDAETEYTEDWETAKLTIEECSLNCKLAHLGETALTLMSNFWSQIIAFLSLTVAILSLIVTVRRN